MLPSKVWDIKEVSSVAVPLTEKDNLGHWSVLMSTSRTPMESELGPHGSRRTNKRHTTPATSFISNGFHVPTPVSFQSVANQGLLFVCLLVFVCLLLVCCCLLLVFVCLFVFVCLVGWLVGWLFV